MRYTHTPAYILDTDVLIWQLRNRAETKALIKKLMDDGPLACSALTVSELLQNVRDHEMDRVAGLLDSLIVLPVDFTAAKLAASLIRQRGPGYVDCHIAATSILLGVPLVTYNRKDYIRTGAVLFDTSEW